MNIVLETSPESAEDRFTVSYQYVWVANIWHIMHLILECIEEETKLMLIHSSFL